MKKMTGILVFIATALVAAQVWAQTEQEAIGQSDDLLSGMKCLISTDFYIVHFTAFQPKEGETDPKERFRPYCRELPEIGKSYLTVDLVDQDARQMPVGLRLVEEEIGAEPNEVKQVRTLLEVPGKVYNTGVVSTEATFDKPGRYALLVDIGEAVAEEDTVRIPLRVGLDSGKREGGGSSGGGGMIIILGAVALILYMGLRFLRQKRTAS